MHLFAAATAAVAALLAPGPFGTVPAPATYVAPNGDDAAACTRVAPCASFDRAYHAARAGQTVLVAPGTYPDQDLTGGAAAGVLIQPSDTRGRVLIDGRLTFEGVAHLRMRNIDIGRSDPYWDMLFEPCNTDVTLENVGGGRYFAVTGGNSDITLQGGSWGGYGAPGEHDSAIGGAGDPGDTCGGEPVQPIRNLVLDGVLFHDSFWGETPEQWGGAHPDCLEIDGYVASMTIRNSAFLRCGDSFIGLYGDLGGPTDDVTIERNLFFDGATYGYWGIQLTDEGHPYQCSGIVFRNNIYHPNSAHAPMPYGPLRTACSGPVPTRVVGNDFQAGPDDYACSVFTSPPYDAVWDGNIFEIADPCGTHAIGPFVRR